jgi:hypothetical protein
MKRRCFPTPGAAIRGLLGAALAGLAITPSCNDPQSPPADPAPGAGDFGGRYEHGTSGLEFRLESPTGGTSTLRLVASDLSFDPATQELHAQVAIRNSGSEPAQGPSHVLVGGFDPETVRPSNAEPLPCPACVGCPCPWPWAFAHQGTYGEDDLLSPGETSTAVEWILFDPDRQSFRFQARLLHVPQPEPGTISGSVFADRNANGHREPDEAGIAGAVVSLGHNDATEEATTGPDGRFAFHITEEGVYEVAREESTDCRPTSPSRLQVVIVRRADGTLAGYDRADFGCGDRTPGDSTGVGVFGIVFHDMNRNGVHERGEPGLPGVLVTGSAAQCPALVPIMAHTDENGFYRMQLPPCDPPYIIHRAPIPGFVDTSPNPLVFGRPDPNGPPTPRPGDPPIPRPFPVLRADFGVAHADSDTTRVGGVAGTVYRDSNRNGLQDDGEPGIPGVGVSVGGLLCLTPVVAVTHTDAEGHYRVSANRIPCPPPWIAAHERIEGTCDTTPNPMAPVVPQPPGGVAQVDFGVADCDSVPPPGGLFIQGVVWIDLDRDGVRERGEPGVPNATLRVETPCRVIIETETDATGHYAFRPAAIGCRPLAVRLVAPEFAVHTTPNPHPVDPANGVPGTSLEIDFGVLPLRR